jgi:hypothetical protein
MVAMPLYFADEDTALFDRTDNDLRDPIDNNGMREMKYVFRYLQMGQPWAMEMMGDNPFMPQALGGMIW